MNLIFDFDGTICDSFEAAIDIVKNHFPEYYTGKITPQKARDMGLKKLLKVTKFPKYKLPKLIVTGRCEMEKSIPKLKTFPSIKLVIKQLSNDHKLGIITSNSGANVKMFLEKNSLDAHFDLVDSSVSVFGKHKKLLKIIKGHQLDLKLTIYIGDETRDIEAAKKARIKSAAVTWGYESEKVLKKARPSVIIRRPRDLITLIN